MKRNSIVKRKSIVTIGIQRLKNVILGKNLVTSKQLRSQMVRKRAGGKDGNEKTSSSIRCSKMFPEDR